MRPHEPPRPPPPTLARAANDNEYASLNSLDRRAYEHLLRRLLALDSRPAVLLLHTYQWWRAAGSAVTKGLFYKEPEQQLTTLSHVRHGQGMQGAFSAVCAPLCPQGVRRVNAAGSSLLLPALVPANAHTPPHPRSTMMCPRSRSGQRPGATGGTVSTASGCERGHPIDRSAAGLLHCGSAVGRALIQPSITCTSSPPTLPQVDKVLSSGQHAAFDADKGIPQAAPHEAELFFYNDV